ncbi:hypothetical protein NDU88_004839 [Pleurodeles waltl]|uniref:Uncharacterized protein n=1 Tax=Pleurodeles waltl TaxID=8319 RepID=A0AAV7WA52_PLEWA|nr:hypothetical protein NDU88_004839 [Pleurodeles waltl]
MEQLFGSLREDFAMLKRDIAADIKDPKKDTASHFLAENDTPETSIATLWENLKVVVRGQFIAIAARQNALRRDKRQQLEDDIRALEETHRQSGSLAVRRQLAVQRKQLGALDEGKAKAGRLLAHRLHIQATECRVPELRLPDGTLTCREELIRQQFKRFYADLYSVEGVDQSEVEDYMDSAPVARLPPVDSAALEKDIKPTEVLEAIHRLKPGKASGADGFGAEFYTSLRAQLAPILARLYNASVMEAHFTDRRMKPKPFKITESLREIGYDEHLGGRRRRHLRSEEDRA